MKKHLFLLLFLLPVFARGQQESDLMKNSYQLMKEMQSVWNLGIDSVNSPFNIRDFNHYKSLFDLNATIDNEFDVYFMPDSVKRTSSYRIDTTTLPFDEYAHQVSLKFIKIKIVTDSDPVTHFENRNNLYFDIRRKVTAHKTRYFVIEDAESCFDSIIRNRVKIEFAKNKNREAVLKDIKDEFIRFVKSTADTVYQFQSVATLRVRLVASDDNQVKIKSIERLSKDYEFKCLNDADQDGVVDGEDKSPKPGDLMAQGYPDYDLDKTIDSLDANKYLYGDPFNNGVPSNYFKYNFDLDGFVGIQINSSQMNLPEPVNTGYNGVDVLQSKKGTISESKMIPSLIIGGNFRWFFGSGRKNTGVSAGFTYSKYTSSYEITSPVVYTYKAWDGSYNYRRVITIEAGSKEKITTSVVNIPVLFNCRFGSPKKDKPNAKKKKNEWHMLFSGGPSLLLFNGTSDYNVSLNAEGMYQTALNGSDYVITYEDYFDANASTNVLLTGSAIDNQNATPGSKAVFDLLNQHGYDFQNNIVKTGTQKNISRTVIAANANFDVHFFITSRFAFKGGLSIVYAPLGEKSGSYKALENTYDSYNSLYNTKAKTGYSAIGLRVGFVNQFNK